MVIAPDSPIKAALAGVPAGRWIVGVSGGADSVALLCGLRAMRSGVEPIVAHLDHETRGGGSAADARFVAELCARLDVPCVQDRFANAASGLAQSNNVEAAFRAARMSFFERVRTSQDARGVLLAHHADDRVETTLLRLLRGGEPTALDGLRAEAHLGTLRVLRPLLAVRRSTLEAYLLSIGEEWRTDESNASDTFARNRLRQWLARRPELIEPTLALADAARAWADQIASDTPTLAVSFVAAALADLPDPLARRAARRWLSSRGSTLDDLSIAVVERLIEMSRDSATPARADFSGGLSVRRRRGRIECDEATPDAG